MMWSRAERGRGRNSRSKGKRVGLGGQDGTEKHGLRDNVPPAFVMVRRQTRERMGGACEEMDAGARAESGAW